MSETRVKIYIAGFNSTELHQVIQASGRMGQDLSRYFKIMHVYNYALGGRMPKLY